jgi:hypothetical protein
MPGYEDLIRAAAVAAALGSKPGMSRVDFIENLRGRNRAEMI